MKYIFTILSILFCLNVGATDYHIKTGGDDAANGDLTHPWATITKVNTVWAAGTFAPGDQILLNRGDTFYGAITVTESGSTGSPITVGAYGTGAKPIITGFTTVSAWTNLGSNIWESTSAVSALSYTNVVVVGGINKAMGRYPNTGYLPYQSYVTNTTITSTSVPAATTNWTGAEVVIKKYRWIIDRGPITNHTSNTLTYTSGSAYYGHNGWGFFIQNDLRTLDVAGEWYFNPSTKKLDVYATSQPTAQLSTIETLVVLNGYNYITFDNISFTGANTTALSIINSQHITVQNCGIDFCNNSIKGDGSGTSNYFTLTNSAINHTNNNAVDLPSRYDYSVISNNTIKNTAVFAGMGGSGDGNHIAMSLANLLNTTVTYNTIDTVGYIGISLTGYASGDCDNMNVSYNYVNHFCFIKDDGAGLYFHGAGTNKVISYNIVLNGIGNNEGMDATYSTTHEAHGIYLDRNNATSGYLVVNNAVANVGGNGIFLNGTHDNVIRANTVFNCGFSSFLLSGGNVGDEVSNIQLKRNILVAKQPDLYPVKDGGITLYQSYYESLTGVLIADSNYYARPIDQTDIIATTTSGPYAYTTYTVAQWQTLTGGDAHSHAGSATVSDTANIHFVYNSTSLTKYYVVSATMVDVIGTSYLGNISLAPWSSLVLMGAGTVTPPSNLTLKVTRNTGGKLLRNSSGKILIVTQ